MKTLTFSIGFFALSCLLTGLVLAEMSLIGEGEMFPRQFLEMPRTERDRLYLGLGMADSFLLDEIAADVLLVEVLNVHCPHCQRQTTAYNELFDLIEENPRTRGRIKMLGVAVGNGWREVDDFRQIYEVAFPVLPDPRFRLHRAIGQGRTPFTIYVRQRGPGQGGDVIATRLGVDSRYRTTFVFLQEAMMKEPTAFLNRANDHRHQTVAARPIMSDEELEAEVWKAFAGLGDNPDGFRKVPLGSGRQVFTVRFNDGKGSPLRYFAEVVSRPSICDVCHDLHFIYVFDQKGRVLRFVPLQLTRHGNEAWSEQDAARMRRRVVGRYLSAPWRFDSEVDAVTSATITSAIIFDSLARGEELMDELKKRGLL